MKKIETEKKFSVTSFEWKNEAEGILYRQGYLSIDPGRTVRVRLEGEKGKFTIKANKIKGSGDEFEYDIPVSEAEYMINNLCLKPVIEKFRYKINFKGNLWEVDEFLGENEGLIIAEIELDQPDQKFEKPRWAGKDVTEDQRYKNANLVKNPYRKWKE